jgi:hypothetical protein
MLGAMDKHQHLTLQLVRHCKSLHRKTLKQNTALSAIIKFAPKERAGLTAATIEDMMEAADEEASQTVDREFSELEEALLTNSDFLPALTRYLDKNQ